jgi:hypothetical protein
LLLHATRLTALREPWVVGGSIIRTRDLAFVESFERRY